MYHLTMLLTLQNDKLGCSLKFPSNLVFTVLQNIIYIASSHMVWQFVQLHPTIAWDDAWCCSCHACEHHLNIGEFNWILAQYGTRSLYCNPHLIWLLLSHSQTQIDNIYLILTVGYVESSQYLQLYRQLPWRYIDIGPNLNVVKFTTHH